MRKQSRPDLPDLHFAEVPELVEVYDIGSVAEVNRLLPASSPDILQEVKHSIEQMPEFGNSKSEHQRLREQAIARAKQRKGRDIKKPLGQ